MATIIATNVGAIDSYVSGVQAITHFDRSIFFEGIDSFAFAPWRIGQTNGHWVAFNLTASIDFGTNFNLSDTGFVCFVIGQEVGFFGNATIENYQQFCEVAGVENTAFGFGFIRPASQVTFDLLEVDYYKISALQFNFPLTDISYASPLGFDLLKSDPFSVRQSLPITCVGFDAFNSAEPFVFSVLILDYTEYNLSLDLNETTTAGVNFHFSESLTSVVSAIGIERAVVAAPIIVPTPAVKATGIDSFAVGLSRVSGDYALRFDFNYAVQWNAANLGFYFGDARALAVSGVRSFVAGSHLIAAARRRIYPYGWRSERLDAFRVEGDGRTRIIVSGHNSFAQAEPIIYNAAQVVKFFSQFGVDALPQTQWGVGANPLYPQAEGFKVYIRVPSIINFQLDGGQDNLAFTQWGCEENFNADEYEKTECTFQVTYSTRWVSLRDPHPGAYVGTAYIGYFDTTVWVPWAQHTQWGMLTVGRHTEFHAPAIYDGGVGQPIVVWGNVLWPVWPEPSSAVSGAKWISHSPRHLLVQQREISERHSEETRVWNSLQFVVQNGGEDYNHKGGMGDRHYIYNVNRTLAVMGLNSLRMPVQFEGVYLTGRALQPPGLNATQYGNQLVADAIRYYTPLSWDSLFVSRYGNQIGNAALNFTPGGIVPTAAFGLANTWNNRQWVKVWQFLSEEIGTQFVAFAEREVVQRPYTWAVTTYGRPYIGLREQFVNLTPTGPYDQERGDFLRLGAFDVVGREIPWFRPQWPNQLDAFGYAKVWNFNPQAWPWGIHTYGASAHMWISHSPRYLEQPGRVPEVLGRPVVVFRDRQFETFGHDSLCAGTALQVRNVAPDPPKPLDIRVTGICLDYAETKPCCTAFGELLLQNNCIVVEGFDALEIAVCWIRVQGCITQTHEISSRFGIPFLTVPTYVQVSEFEKILEGPFWAEVQEAQATQWGKPRLSPHTIWCQRPAPLQAKKNHRDTPEAYREFCWPTYKTGDYICEPPKTFGDFRVELKQRTLLHYHEAFDYNKSEAVGGWVSSPIVKHGTQYIHPAAFASSKAGIPAFIPRTLKVFISGFGYFKVGSCEIINAFTPNPDPQTIAAVGAIFTQWGQVQLDPKTLWPDGFSATLWGNNNPMVHFPLVLYVSGFDATEWGDAQPTHWIRYLELAGIMSPEWWMDDFDDRMQVIGGNQFNPDVDLVFVDSFIATEWGDWEMPVSEIKVTPYMVEPPCIPCHVFEIKNA